MPKMIQTHLIEDEMERLILSIRTKLDIFEQLSELLQGGYNNRVVQQQIEQIRSEVTSDLSLLQRSGYSIGDVLSRLDRIIYRKDLTEAVEKMAENEQKGRSHRIVDLFNEDRLLQERNSVYIRNPEQDSLIESMIQDFMANTNMQSLYQEVSDDVQQKEVNQDFVFSDEEEPQQQESVQNDGFTVTTKMLGNQEVRKIKQLIELEQNAEAKKIAKEILQEYINKKQRKEFKYDVNPKSKKFGALLNQLFPNVDPRNKSAEAYAKLILQAP